MKKKTGWIFFGVVTVACVLILSFLYLTWIVHYMPSGGGYTSVSAVSFNITVTDEGWTLTVESITRENKSEIWGQANVIYELRRKHGAYNLTMLEVGTLASIKDASSGHGIKWFDADNNDMLSMGDVIFIDKSGGYEGSAALGDRFGIIVEKGSTSATEAVL